MSCHGVNDILKCFVRVRVLEYFSEPLCVSAYFLRHVARYKYERWSYLNAAPSDRKRERESEKALS